MSGMIIFLVIVMLVVYITNRNRIKKRKNSLMQMNSVDEYHEAFDRIRTRKEIRDRENQYTKYVTKYNSQEDYRDKRGL